ncbi:GNAT family N-acetyltransferase [Brachybacterium sp. EF45031]|uniref:GNAT family N-acetyltransferase n=1 Tax=Brachybacterium sillae TaxID=2810536 RepID=UPI00217E6DED|nr:GNAT family N-acetyltransferase [Brachybacterium sillae]MCS6711779.1 GNAT family N-acetyltransferase [Brachybacterium sillae]
MPADLATLFPPFALRLRSGDLTLRLLRDEDLPQYAELLRRPIFADTGADHVFPWYAVPEEERIASAITYQWALRTRVQPEDWTLSFGVFAGQRLIGMQDLRARELPRRGVIESGSWLTLSEQGRGYGGRMRRMAVAFAFDHLGALRAESSAVLGNEPSLAVSSSCGYVPNGTEVVVEGGRRLIQQRVAVTPETFERRGLELEVDGLTPALRALLGAGLTEA